MSELKPCPFCGSEQPQDSKDDGNVPYEFGMSRSCKFCSAAVNLGWNTRPIEDALNARIAELEAEVTKCHELQDSYCDRIAQLEKEIARRDEELLELNNKAVFIKFENEDELPAEIKDDVYSAMFECSHVDGVRLFPYIEENEQKYFLVMLKEVV